MTRAPFGTSPDGAAAELFTLTNAHGLSARITNYGGIITALLVPDRYGRLADVVLGYDTLADYLAGSAYFGALIGRYANRIAGARFTLDGETCTLAANDGPHHLHGGLRGFDKVLWQAAVEDRESGAALLLRHVSPDGDQGYPGTMHATVAYTLTDQGDFIVDYLVTTSRPTPVSLTQHSYFNLAGAGDVLDHQLQLKADAITPVDRTLIPTGGTMPVAGTPFDFRRSAPVGARIAEPHEQLAYGHGYDHNFVLDRFGEGLEHAARVVEPRSGRALDVFTTEPGLQLYTANWLDGVRGKGGAVYGRHAGLCLETQHFPDSPNQPSFPSPVVRPGAAYRSRTVFAFGVPVTG